MLIEKSKVMRVSRKGEECQKMIGDEQLKQVDTMKHLGVTISRDGDWNEKWRQELGIHLELLGE